MNLKTKATALFLFILVGCQAMPYKPYARRVKMSASDGGIVALRLEHNEQDRTYAEELMQTSCKKKKFSIAEEGEVVIGTETQSNETQKAGESGKKVGSLWGIPISTSSTDPSKATSSTTLEKKEWQIRYKCS